MIVKALARLDSTADTQEVSGTVKDAAVAISKIFQKNGLDWKVTAKPSSEAGIADFVRVSGKTSLGGVNFDIYLTGRRELSFDYYESKGLYADDKLLSLVDKIQTFMSIDGTRKSDLQDANRSLEATKDAAIKSKEAYDASIAIQTAFLKSVQQIKALMLKNPV